MRVWSKTIKKFYVERVGKRSRRFPRGKDDTRFAEMKEFISNLKPEEAKRIAIPDRVKKLLDI